MTNVTDEQIANLPRHKIAMLIDGDNAQAGLLSQMLVEAARYGQVTVRRIYGDWTTPSMNSWKETLNFHAFQPIQQFRYTVGKNATDSAMIIDAMDVMHSNVVDAFCLVSSDSDYTRLATRIRETGIFVMGIGEKKTPKPFVNACDGTGVVRVLIMPIARGQSFASASARARRARTSSQTCRTLTPPSSRGKNRSWNCCSASSNRPASASAIASR